MPAESASSNIEQRIVRDLGVVIHVAKMKGYYYFVRYYGNAHWQFTEARVPNNENRVRFLSSLNEDQWVDSASRALEEMNTRFEQTHGHCPDFAGRRDF